MTKEGVTPTPGSAVNVVVVFDPDAEERAVLQDRLAGRCRLTFLGEVARSGRARALSEAEILMAWRWRGEIEPEDLPLLGGVRFVQLISAGVDHMPFDQLLPRAVLSGNVGAYSGPIAEHVVGMTLALAKALIPAHLELTAGRFDDRTRSRVLAGGVAGILGYGGIGRACAALLRGIGMRIHAVNRTGRPEEGVAFAATLDDLEAVMRAADVLVISIPLTRATRGLIGSHELAWMKPESILVNVARGAIVDERALYERLRQAPGFGAGIDTWWGEPFRDGAFHTEFPFFDLPNVVGSPHNSGIVPGDGPHAAGCAAENVLRYLRGEPVTGVADPDDYPG